MSAPTIDVVILTWNDGELLAESIRSARESIGVDVRVIVVDNGSSPAAEVPEEALLIRSETNLGVAAGRNRGIAAGDNEFVLILDSDAALTSNALSELLAPLLNDETIAMAVPVYIDQEPEESAGLAPTLGRKIARVRNQTSMYGAVERTEDDPLWDVDFGIGACQLFRRSSWEQINGIDEAYFYGPEDADFCMRMKLVGGRVVQVGSALVDHPPRRRFRGLATKRGMAHAWAVARFLWRHRNFDGASQLPAADRSADQPLAA